MDLPDTSGIIKFDSQDPSLSQRVALLGETGLHAISSVTVFEFLFGVFVRYKQPQLEKAVQHAVEFLSAFVILSLD